MSEKLPIDFDSEQFIKFLKDNDAYENFMKNTTYVNIEDISLDEFYFDTFKSDWSETDEGFEYWEDITDKWFEHISVNDQDDEI